VRCRGEGDNHARKDCQGSVQYESGPMLAIGVGGIVMIAVGAAYAFSHPWPRGEPVSRKRTFFICLTVVGIALEVIYIAVILSQETAVPV
jgi:hypothetical protein